MTLKLVSNKNQDVMHRFCVAPMMDWSDRHCRAFHRVLTRRARLYTEMITATAVIRGDRQKLLGYDPSEHPLALQLGGSDPKELARAAQIGEEFGYGEINLNVGCPSDRVQSGRFGACLMREPALVAECMGAIIAAVKIPATVKCRIGVDEQDPQQSLFSLVEACSPVGVNIFVVHARKAWLEGLSPKENREIPPLDYGLVRRLKSERPDLTLVLNGGITTVDEAIAHLEWADGVMIGRAAYHNPGMLAAVDSCVYGEKGILNPAEAVSAYRGYMEAQLRGGVPMHAMTRHMLGLFSGSPGARSWRRILTVESIKAGAGLEVLDRALEALEVARSACELRSRRLA